MPEYIDREALLAEFEWLKSVEYPYQRDRTEDAIWRIKNAPSTDVTPVVHGIWIPFYESEVTGWNPEFAGCDPIAGYECSNCNEEATLDCNNEFVLSKFCPNCGAKMDGGMEMVEYTNKENCTECTHHNIFLEGPGCNLLNNMEHCKFEQKVKPDLSLLFASLEDIIDATD